MEAHVPVTTMDRIKILEETLREASCVGDIDIIRELIGKGINVNSRHEINGWTALHWAAKRGHKTIVSVLLENGASKTALTNKNETPASLCSNSEILGLLESLDISSDTPVCAEGTPLPIMPNYLKHPPLNGKVDTGNVHRRNSTSTSPSSSNCTTVNTARSQANCLQTDSDELVLKVRVANSGDPDFIEIELPRVDLTYSRLLRTCCEELNVTPTQVFRIRKLPDTIVRKDKDVQRLTDFQEIEMLIASDRGSRMPVGSNGPVSVNGGVNSYQSISLYKNQTILY